MKLRAKQLILIPLLVLIVGHYARASDFGRPNSYNTMADTLFDMMDAFSSAYQRHRGDQNGYPPIGGPNAPYRSKPPPEFVLTGTWQGQSGVVMVIEQGVFRVFRSPHQYRDGRIWITDATHFELIDLQTGLTRYYEFAESQGRLILRDPYGEMLLFRRFSR